MKKFSLVLLVLAVLAVPVAGPSQNTSGQRARIKQLLETDQLEGAIWRAVLKILLDELNNHADKHNAILDAMDAATSLQDLKTRVAAIPNYPQRTRQQLINAMKSEMGVE